MPTNTLAAVERPTTPPTPIVRSSSQEMARTTRCSTPQWYSSAESALITSTIGSARKARMKFAFASVTAKGAAPPPR